ncbi:major capsid protein [Pannonibacter tanglangensis]|uniref:Major capsid protein n=1 Tax=Pannonibacter tanglangensis TaxID=2750084 RepID=A0ABW9ZJ85_9HYPH|nr:major capsid protein [Pannonibacter sp. XCT-34]NBN62790.1 major capsid protein [Pannonibacter sp. XCT-34]
MPTLNIFEDDAFSVQSLTAVVNDRPYRPGQVSAMGLFEEDGVNTTTVSIERDGATLGLVEPTPRGGPGETTADTRRDLIAFRVDHYQRDDAVLADEVQNMRAFGSESELETVTARVMKKMERHLADLDMTLEFTRVGAMKGIVTARSGTVLHNLYSRFSIAVPASISLELDVDSTRVDEILEKDVCWSIEDSLDSFYDGFYVLTGRDFHLKLWNHPRLRETFLATEGAAALRGPVPDRFQVGKFTFERYRTGRRAREDAGAAYIADDEARVAPRGVPGLFITRFSPADYEETVNTDGLPRYMRQWAMPNGKGRHFEVQSNPISMCTRPQALRRLQLT